MTQSNQEPKKRGRPATGRQSLIALRLPAEMLARLDAYRGVLNRSEAIREMIQYGLPKRRRAGKEGPRP